MFWTRLWRRLRSLIAPLPQIGPPLWLRTVQHYPFLNALALHEQAKLRTLSALFLQHKQFYGGHGLVVTDAMAVAIAAHHLFVERPFQHLDASTDKCGDALAAAQMAAPAEDEAHLPSPDFLRHGPQGATG